MSLVRGTMLSAGLHEPLIAAPAHDSSLGQVTHFMKRLGLMLPLSPRVNTMPLGYLKKAIPSFIATPTSM